MGVQGPGRRHIHYSGASAKVASGEVTEVESNKRVLASCGWCLVDEVVQKVLGGFLPQGTFLLEPLRARLAFKTSSISSQQLLPAAAILTEMEFKRSRAGAVRLLVAIEASINLRATSCLD